MCEPTFGTLTLVLLLLILLILLLLLHYNLLTFSSLQFISFYFVAMSPLPSVTVVVLFVIGVEDNSDVLR